MIGLRIAAGAFLAAFFIPIIVLLLLAVGHGFYFAFTGVWPNIHVTFNQIAAGCFSWFVLFGIPSGIILWVNEDKL